MAIKTVTQDGWGVSVTSGGPSNDHVLHVYRFPVKSKPALMQKGDAYGMIFPSDEVAFAYALEHGYLKPFVTAWCSKCRVLHTFLGRKSGFCYSGASK